ncbi:hypothetical protein [Shinella zoogloeoides]|uniref:hypothetical protein n=1 Tax=Shinella zoogloeoides TaxID=352475 RepID=UPI00299F12C2|nr:hypothetical protein [Shinella zoogloeoides]WPE19934.1 hypothetical protein ShzoTeo12_11120 [Shinella zoogloeoides]
MRDTFWTKLTKLFGIRSFHRGGFVSGDAAMGQKSQPAGVVGLQPYHHGGVISGGPVTPLQILRTESLLPSGRVEALGQNLQAVMNAAPGELASIEMMRESVIRRAIGPTILLGSGTYFDFEAPELSEITIEDVAYGLAFEGRCAGQCFSRITGRRVFYSVAEHCVRMSWVVPEDLALEALMHEVGEAVCGDMTGPLKSMIPRFKSIEKRCEAAILDRFGVSIDHPLEIKIADTRMFATERRDLLPWRGEAWSAEDRSQPYDFEIVPWAPEVAAEEFLRRYHELRGTCRRD